MKSGKKLFVAAALLGLAAFPLAVPNPYYIHLLVVIGIYSILLFGLDIVVGYTGEVSLGHAGLFGVGAYAAGLLFVDGGWPFWLALPAAAAITAAFGAALAMPALRVTGPYLAMVTLAFGTIVGILINEMDFLTYGPQGLTVSKPEIFGRRLDATDFYYLTLVAAFFSMIAVTRLLNSHFGRAFVALRGSPVAADCMGVSVYKFKVLAFIVSAALAGLAGGMFAFSEEYIAPNAFNFELAVLFLLAVTLGGRKSRLGSILGAAVIVMLPNLLSDVSLFRMLSVAIALSVAVYLAWAVKNTPTTGRQAAAPLAAVVGLAVFAFMLEDISEHRLTIFGLMILGVVFYLPNGVTGHAKELLKRLRPEWFRDESAATSVAGAAGTPTAGVPTAGVLTAGVLTAGVLTRAARCGDVAGGGPLLRAEGVVKQFGGLRAVDDLSLSVAPGAVHGLIGPNGSGKSTMMNVLTGVYTPTTGTVVYDGKTISGRTPSEIARAGVARTFQNVQLFGDMTSLENILVGLHHTFRSSMLDVVFNTPRFQAEERAARAAAAGLLNFVGLAEFADEEARNLPYGRMRLLEIGRALALDPRLLLLDEPAAGLPPAELPDLVAMIDKIRNCGVGVILIEHHMDVVMSICDRVTVLDFGRKIAEGTGAEVRNDPRVIEAYLGADSSSSIHADNDDDDNDDGDARRAGRHAAT